MRSSNHLMKLTQLKFKLKFLTYEVELYFISCLCRVEVERINFLA